MTSGVTIPPPLALARITDTLTPPGLRDFAAEPKFDGFRAVFAGSRLWSRHGTDLTRYFPDLVPVLVAQLPADVCLDAEVVCWDVDKGRLDFAALGRRLTAGRRLASVAKGPPGSSSASTCSRPPA